MIVVAVGGNALIHRGDRLDVDVQRRNARHAASAIAAVARHHRVVLTHGNGPQVGLLALQNEAYREAAPYPMDVLDAESEGMIGYLLEQELGRTMCTADLATILTQVVVDVDDPAFAHPTKPVGPVYGATVGARLAVAHGWTVATDGGGVRRVVPSPEPLDIVELRAIEVLVAAGVLVICAGGGGIPVARLPRGFRGVEAVIDKDLSAALLATKVRADVLLLLTDVEAVYRDFGTPTAAPIRRATPRELRAVPFAEGSMRPKVEAACRFVDATGGRAAIGSLTDAVALVAGEVGTQIGNRP